MSRPRLYVARALPDPVMAEIRARFDLTNAPTPAPPSPHQLLEGLAEADAAICTLTEAITQAVLLKARTLRIVANCAVGYNNIDLDAAKARSIIVTNTPDVLTEATADLTWALLLAAARRIVEGDRLVRSGTWTGWEPTQLLGADVYGKTLGIIGLGRIGQAVVRRAQGFGMRILSVPRRNDQPPPLESVWQQTSLQTLLETSDFVSLHLPLTTDTRHFIGTKELRLMKPSAFLINTSRGPVVDETALVSALQAGQLAGAGFDVYEREPAIHPGLIDNSRVVLLPHLGSATTTTRIRMGMMCVENVTAVLKGQPAPNRVA
ncbi:MAG: D-glycerate dehydrogenase [Nitrospirae bacterium]|nr:D-glycerate dehydrogenase [Nitrospirota bacterium]